MRCNSERLGICLLLYQLDGKESLACYPKGDLGLIYRLHFPRSPSTLPPKSTENDKQNHIILESVLWKVHELGV